MYSKQESARIKTEFWTAFGQYMSPVPSSEGEKINWINYRTGEKDIYFRMHADNKKANIAIELTHKDEGIREIYFEQFLQLKNILHAILNEEWTWQKEYHTGGKSISRIYTEMEGASIMNKEQWPQLISFFKPRIMALDEFWSQVKYGFESLR